MNLPSNTITREFMELRPAGGFKVILADPPWSFDNYSAKGEKKNAKSHYNCMNHDELKLLPVELLAASDCALFIWCTWPLMPIWRPVIESWGFEYASLAWEWIKFNSATGKYAFGPGYGTRKNLEPCLLARKGSPHRRDCKEARSVRDFIKAKAREHSRKPDEQYQRIEALFDGPYIELFARQRRSGWSAWGNQTDKFNEATK